MVQRYLLYIFISSEVLINFSIIAVLIKIIIKTRRYTLKNNFHIYIQYIACQPAPIKIAWEPLLMIILYVLCHYNNIAT